MASIQPAEIATEAAERYWRTGLSDVPHRDAPAWACPVTIEDMVGLVKETRRLMPEVGIQIPPNLADWWPQLVEAGATDRIFYDVRHRYTEALLDSIPRMTTSKTEPLYSIPGQPPDLSRPPHGCRFAARCAYATEECRAEVPPFAGAFPGAPAPATRAHLLSRHVLLRAGSSR